MVIRLKPENAEALRNLRWEAITLHPTSFAADPDIESRLTIDDWRERLRQNAWFGGIIEDELVAMVVLLIEASKKVKHTGHLASMYVRENERGTGLADELMEAGCWVSTEHNAELPVMPSTGQIEGFDGIPFEFAAKWTRHYRSLSPAIAR